MAIVTGQVASTSPAPLSTTAVAPLVLAPAGASTLVVSNVSGATVFVGEGSSSGAPTAAVLQASGFPIPSGAPPVSLPLYSTSRAVQMYVIAITGGTLTGSVGYVVSSAS